MDYCCEVDCGNVGSEPFGGPRLCDLTSDTILREDFCPMYYWGSGDCEALKSHVKFNHTRPAPTLELGDPSKPALFFIHGFPDTAALWVNQFEYFCAPPQGKYFCIAPTWMNFHPDFPDAPPRDLFHDVQLDRMYATAKEMGLQDITLVTYDFGAILGYRFTYKYAYIVKKIVSFEQGMPLVRSLKRRGGDAEIPLLPQYQQACIHAFRTNNFAYLQPFKDWLMSILWRGHDPKFFQARTAWPYNSAVLNGTNEEWNERFVPDIPLSKWKFRYVPDFPNDKPVLFLYGKCEEGSGCDRCQLGKKCIPRKMLWHDKAFENWVNERPGSQAVPVDGAGHWPMTVGSVFVNKQMATYFES